ncbi:helix-turn-helix transcriptional regulator [Rhodococcus triatomae]|uniref:helix-turn-helix transcriptional regulator n=1 Tax=Rhodococcus triatomae TaxID=300028 RepID=UPI001474E52F|nr:AraC family transcriptional regulator [Rhodococcus triatomae]QNG18327.1 helix-turn-helix transcriptional regulator [Rhodococcus triatomae]QNG22003.1 helix-turn-helix transcriptional regulator [Rhodococcus triatomae]
MPHRVEWEPHAHATYHELVWGCKGALTVETDEGYFAIPSGLGLWIPAGVRHRVVAAAGTAFRCTFVVVEVTAVAPTVTAVFLPEVVRAVLERLEANPVLAAASRIHAEELAFDLLEPVEIATVDLPFPSDGRTRAVAEAILADPADNRAIDEWGRVVGSSPRNLSRLFSADTGLSFAQWRTRARMRRAVEWLAAGQSVSGVARRVGYATPSAFVQAFRREIGLTPGEFASGHDRGQDKLASLRHSLSGLR